VLPLDGQLGIKYRESSEIVPIPGTEGARNPAYSPDSQWLAYVIDTDVFKRPLVGGAAIRIAGGTEAPPLRVALTWLDDGTLLYEGDRVVSTQLVQIPENGGVPLAEFGRIRTALAWVQGLPGARGALVVTIDNGLFLLDLRAGSTELLMEGVSRAWYSPTGHLVYVRSDGAVFAQPFDLDALALGDAATPLFEGVHSIDARTADMLLGGDGTVLYLEGLAVGSIIGTGARLTVVDLEGNRQTLPLGPRNFGQLGPSWSPDGASVTYASEGQIYTYNTVLNTTPRQVTFEGTNSRPVYSPDGARIAFSSGREGTAGLDVFIKDLNDDAPPRSLITLDGNQFVMGWPADTLIVFERGQNSNRDLWLLDLSDPDAPEARPYLTSEADLERIVVSPDGRVAAYRSDESGIDEIYVRSFPNPGERTLVSRGGGAVPYWAPDGRTLFYYAGLDRPWVAGRLQREPVLAVQSLDTLFTLPPLLVEPFPGPGLHPDGDRFIVALPAGGASTAPEDADDTSPQRLILIRNFFTELRERVAIP